MHVSGEHRSMQRIGREGYVPPPGGLRGHLLAQRKLLPSPTGFPSLKLAQEGKY